MSGFDQFAWPGPKLPDLPTQSMPEVMFDAQVSNMGLRFGWLKAHSCPCTYSAGTPGSPNPQCNTCNGRGVYWDAPIDCLGHLTYMHTSAAPDEPGSHTDELTGHTLAGEPVLTIPYGLDPQYPEDQTCCPASQATVWAMGSSFDCWVEYDAVTRYNTVLVQGQNMVLPYQWGVTILAVTAYATGTNAIVPVATGNYTYSNGVLELLTGLYPNGTSYTVEYTASPIHINYRVAGGVPHARPLAQGRSRIPRRFHVKNLDAWLRDRFGGELPGAGLVPPAPGTC